MKTLLVLIIVFVVICFAINVGLITAFFTWGIHDSAHDIGNWVREFQEAIHG